MTLSTPTLGDNGSPALRRSPRFMRTDSGQPNALNCPEECFNRTPEPQSRRLCFNDTAQPVSVPRSVVATPEPRNTTSALAESDVHVLQRTGYAGGNTSPPHSPERITNTLNSQTHQISTPEIESGDTIQVESDSGRQTELGAVVEDFQSPESDAAKVRISAADEMTRVFGFVSQIPVKRIRSILKSYDWRQSGKKEALVAKVILHLRLALLSGRSLDETLSLHQETSRYESWLRMRLSRDETYPVSIDRVPNEKTLIALLPDIEANDYRRKKMSVVPVISGTNTAQGILPDESAPNPQENDRVRENQPDNEPTRTNPGSIGITENTQFGINEFARLLITIRDDEDAKCAVIAMGQELTRAQLDEGVTRGDFWGIVESRFNDARQNRFLSLTGDVDDVDSSLPPLMHRSSTFLKDKFNDAKADFTQYVTRWSASGQNDPERFRNFLPTLPNGELNALGKRMMVMFVCTRKGTPFEETHFSNVCCKLIPGGAGRDEGSRRRSFSGEGAAAGSSRRKRSQPDSGGVKEIASSLSRIASCYQERKEVTKTSSSEKLLKDFSCRLKKIKILEDVVKKLSAAAGASPQDTAGQASLVSALRKLQRDVSKDLIADTEDTA